MASFATVSDMRDTVSFGERVLQSSEPIQVMKGRERKMVVMSSELFEHYEQLVKQSSFEAKLREAEADTEAGRVHAMDGIQANMRAKYGL